MTTDKDTQEPRTDAPDPELPFRALLYRFLFFDWLFRDVSSTRTLLERHAARQHNRRMSRYLPVYLRRWSFLTAFDFALGMLFEKVLQAGLLSAWCFTFSCVTFTGMIVITVAWIILNHARLS
jgi:hypothetical protein